MGDEPRTISRRGFLGLVGVGAATITAVSVADLAEGAEQFAGPAVPLPVRPALWDSEAGLDGLEQWVRERGAEGMYWMASG